MKILVTGAAGFIGSNLAETLADAGHEVLGIDCFSNYYSPILKEMNAKDIGAKGVKIVRKDLATNDLVSEVKGVQIVYHLAAQPGISNKVPYEQYVKNNETATFRLLEALRTSDTLECFVNIGTSSVYGKNATVPETTPAEPASYYGTTKLAAEQLALSYYRDFGFPACSLRLFSVYGERERPDKLYPRLIMSILEDKAFPLYEGSEQHLRSYTYIKDILDGFLLMPANINIVKGEIFNIGTDKAITTGEGIRIVEEIMGKKAIIDRKPRRAGEQDKTAAVIDKARKMLGYKPETSPREGLEKDVKWFKEKIYGKFDYWKEVFGTKIE